MSTPTRLSPPKLILATLSLVVWPALVLFLAGDWRWPEGWIFGGWFLAMYASTIAWLYREDPALLAERYRIPGSGGQSRRDQPDGLVRGLAGRGVALFSAGVWLTARVVGNGILLPQPELCLLPRPVC
jgi:hypothetical protein